MTALLTIVSIAAAFVIAALAVGLVRGGISDMGQTDWDQY